MTEEECLCDRTYRAHQRQESKPEKHENRSLPRHKTQDHKVLSFVLNGTTLRHSLMLLWFKDLMNVTRSYNS